MKYQIGKQGRVVVAKFDDGEDILKGITNMVKDENIRSAYFFLVGGMKGGRFVVGPQDETLPPKPMWREINESHEIFGNGTIFWEGDNPKIHFHGAYAKGDDIRAGCLRENSKTFLIIEAVVIEIEGIDAERVLDEKIGLPLLKL
ncbi:MAG: PPC domain-containing DNA-binding protein [Thermodesulfovibrionales bacterium]